MGYEEDYYNLYYCAEWATLELGCNKRKQHMKLLQFRVKLYCFHEAIS